MLTAWIPAAKGLIKHEATGCEIPVQAVWIDATDITHPEEAQVEGLLDIDVPSRAEMQEIEASSRLYRDGEAAVMTATLLVKTETQSPESTPVTFILTRERLLTLRYAEPWSFRVFATRAGKSGCLTAEQTFASIMETTVERLADMLELVGLELDHLGQQIFRAGRGASSTMDRDMQKALLKLGTCGTILSKVRESLIDKNRVITFAQQGAGDLMGAETRGRLAALMHDVQTLSDHASFMSTKVGFLLDATLGLINIEQNRTFKFFTLISIIFMPINVIAGMGGMSEFSRFAIDEAKLPFWVAYGGFTFVMVSISAATWWFLLKFGPGTGGLRKLWRG